MTNAVWYEGKRYESVEELEKMLNKQVTRGEGKYGLTGWLRSFFINLKPFPEPYSLRQIFYQCVPRIANEFTDFVKDYPEDWGDRIYNLMSSILSNLVLDRRCSYRALNIMEDSGASNYIYQKYAASSIPPPERCVVELPIEVWVENNATFNSLLPLFAWNPVTEKAHYQINLLSGKGFAKTNTIEEALLDRSDDMKFVLYFGDFDPSGVEMPQDIQRRFDRIGLDAQVTHVGITPNQIPEERKLTTLIHYKKTDSRAKKFQEKYGIDAVAYETQALTPSEMRNLVSGAIESNIKENGLKRLVD